MINETELNEDLSGDIIPEINPEKLFDEKEYSTIIIGNDSTNKKDIELVDYITIMISPKTSREEKDEALLALKQPKAKEFLINAISKTKKTEQKTVLIAACWEIGLDFSSHYQFFIDLICTNNFLVSFEALTVIQEMEAEITKEEERLAIEKLTKVNEPNVSVTDAIELITNKLNKD